jgi:AcrR family transcriptional regulator
MLALRAARGTVPEIQRTRMIAAALDALAELGYARMTVQHVISRARVSRKTFYDVFSDKEDCFLAAFQQTIEEARRHATAAYHAQPCWRDGVRSGLAVLLEMIDEEPGLARVCVVEALAGGERVLECRAEALDELSRALDRGRAVTANHNPPSLTGEALAGAILAVLHARLVEQRPEPFRTLLGPLMSLIVLPYLGVAAARKELHAQSPPSARLERPSPTTSDQDPLAGLNIRLTYRTVCALAVIAAHPGASNREIAERCGIVDQGQISKLLNRLAALELVENHGAGQPHGCANAWRLTARGAQLERATNPRLSWGQVPGKPVG